jgi:hypothetical protein
MFQTWRVDLIRTVMTITFVGFWCSWHGTLAGRGSVSLNDPLRRNPYWYLPIIRAHSHHRATASRNAGDPVSTKRSEGRVSNPRLPVKQDRRPKTVLACQVSAARSMSHVNVARTKPVKDSSLAPHRTNEPSFTGASAHRWRSRTAASDPHVPSWSQPLAQLASKHRAAAISPRGQQGSLA